MNNLFVKTPQGNNNIEETLEWMDALGIQFETDYTNSILPNDKQETDWC